MISNSCDVLLLSAASGGGVRKVNVILAGGLSKSGLNVCIASPEVGNPFFDTLNKDIKIYKLGSKNNIIIFIISLINVIKETNPKVILCSQDQVILPIAILIKLKFISSKVVAIVHNNPIVHRKNKRLVARLLPFFISKGYKMCNEVVAVSKQLKLSLQNNFEVPSDKICTIYNPVVDLNYNYVPIKGFPHKKYIVSAGNFNHQKDFVSLIYAFKLISNEYLGRLIILGEGYKKNKMISVIHDLNLADRVILPGFVNNVFDYFFYADCFVMSSKWEGFGNVLVEALFMGCPVVSTDCDFGPKEIINHSSIGRLSPVGNIEKLSHNISTALKQNFDSDLLINRAKQFSYDESVNNYILLINKFL